MTNLKDSLIQPTPSMTAELEKVREAKHYIGRYANLDPNHVEEMSFCALLNWAFRIPHARQTIADDVAGVIAATLDTIIAKQKATEEALRVALGALHQSRISLAIAETHMTERMANDYCRNEGTTNTRQLIDIATAKINTILKEPANE